MIQVRGSGIPPSPRPFWALYQNLSMDLITRPNTKSVSSIPASQLIDITVHFPFQPTHSLCLANIEDLIEQSGANPPFSVIHAAIIEWRPPGPMPWTAVDLHISELCAITVDGYPGITCRISPIPGFQRDEATTWTVHGLDLNIVLDNYNPSSPLFVIAPQYRWP